MINEWKCAAAATVLAVTSTPGFAAGALPTELANAPANTWVKLIESKTGGRQQPLFVYASGIKRFILASGNQGPTYGAIPRHYDTEEFDLAAGKWVNAYPPALAAGRPESGPVGEAYAKERQRFGNSGGDRGGLYMDGDFPRIVSGGQWAGVAVNSFAWCYVPDSGRIYVSPRNRMFVYDTVARTWAELQTKPREKCLIWGSMCYDPVNKEILHTGGGGGSADVSTWVYSLEKNEWRRLESGSAKLKELFAGARDLRWQAKTLLGRCSSRHAVAETEDEAKVDLAAEASKLAAAAEAFASDVTAAGLAGTEKTAGDAAARRLRSAAAALKTAGPTLTGVVTPEKIAAIRSIRVIFEQAADALAPEPPGRARSQTAYDPIRKKIVLFGGDALDRTLSDTWLYDCATRAWEQKFPEKCPAPRAGHILGWLPKAGQVVLAGGYSRHPLPQEIWAYDAGANEWKLLLHVPLVKNVSPNSPRAGLIQPGAVGEDDVLVGVDGDGKDAMNTWACRVDVGKVDVTGTATRAVASGTYDFHVIDPAIWEKAAQPEPEKTRKFLESLPANQWTALNFPRYAPGEQNRWGTSAYDTDRHQFLLWGGGHATSHENDVGHFSLLGGFWTIGYHPDAPIEPAYAFQPVMLSFNDRAHVPMHAYNGYCYDPASKRMFYMDRAYDPLVREWLPEGIPGIGPLHANPEVTYNTFLEATPNGAVLWSGKGIFRYDVKANCWQPLPWNGPMIGRPFCDGHAMVHDAKRDCLWLATDKTIMRYDLASGQAQMIEFKKPSALGKYIFYRDAAHLPEADLVLIMRLFQRPDGKFGNVAWNPTDSKFYWVNLKFIENDKPVELKEFNGEAFHWSDALAYDPGLKLLVINNNNASKVWVMRFDRQTAGLEEMKDE